MVSEADLHAFHFTRIAQQQQSTFTDPSSSTLGGIPQNGEVDQISKSKRKSRSSEGDALITKKKRGSKSKSGPGRQSLPADSSSHSLPFRPHHYSTIIRLHDHSSDFAQIPDSFQESHTVGLDSSTLPDPSTPPLRDSTPFQEPISNTYITPKRGKRTVPDSEGYDQLISSSVILRDRDMSETSELLPSSPQHIPSSPLTHMSAKKSKKERTKKAKVKVAAAQVTPGEDERRQEETDGDVTPADSVSTPTADASGKKRKKRESEGGKELKKRGKGGPSWVVETPKGD